MPRLSSFDHIAAVIALSAALLSVPAGAGTPAATEWKGPRIFLSDSKPLLTHHIGSTSIMSEMAGGSAQPLSLAAGDLDEDGVDDLVVGYGTGRGGIIAIHRGNLDAFAPQSQKSFDDMMAGRFPSPFLEDIETFDIPVRPDFIALGNFTGESEVDLLVASRDGNGLYVLEGDGKRGFAKPRVIDLPGAVTALGAAAPGSNDGFSRIAVAVASSSRAATLFVYRGSAEGLHEVAMRPLDGKATQIAFGELDGTGRTDAAVLAGGRVLVLEQAHWQLRPVSLPKSVMALAIGSFVFDRNPGQQMALLTTDGDLQFAARDGLDPRPYSAEEFAQLRADRLQGRARSVLQALSARGDAWKVIETLSALASPAMTHVPIVLRTRVSGHAMDDVMIFDSATDRMLVMSRPDAAPGEKTFRPATISARTHAGRTIQAVATRVSVDARPGIVSIESGQRSPRFIAPLAAATINVNTTLDTIDACATTGTGTCSVRDAVLYASAAGNAGSTINIPSGTYTLTRPKVTNDYSGNNGALYVNTNGSVTIVGAGQGSTFLQAGSIAYNAGTPNGVDMVMAVNEDINPKTNATASLSGLTIQNGHNRGTHGNDGDGGCMEFDTGTGGTANLFLTNVTLRNCDTTQGNGGGLASFNFLVNGPGMATISNCIIQGNKGTDSVVAGGATGGGVWVTDPSRMLMTNSQVISNAVPAGVGIGGGLSILSAGSGSRQTVVHNCTISSNQANGSGGGVYATANLLIDQGTVISGNSAGLGNLVNQRSGGGLYMNTKNPDSVTLTNVALTGNAAPNGNGGGISLGNLSSGFGTLNVQFSRLAGNTVGGTGTNLENINGTVTAANNWWGTNAPLSTITMSGSAPTTTVAPYVVLSNTATPLTINTTQSTTLKASLALESDGTTASDLTVLTGLGVTWGNAIRGALSGQQTTIQSNGMATATLTQDGTCGNTSADATVDQQTVTGSATVQCPDLIASKTNSVGGTTPFPNPWTWTIHVSNIGAGFTPFAAGNTIVKDNLPNANVTYGAVSVLNQTNVTGTGTISCGIASNDLTCTASGGTVHIAGTGTAAGSFDVQFTATPTAAGTFANPRGGGTASVNPNGDIGESNTGNDSFSDSVLVTEPDLTLSQTNSVSGATTLGNNWIWTLTVSNVGNGGANFTAGQTILSDNLPNSNIGYGAVTPGTFTNITNAGNISCSITSNNLTCTATGPVTIGATTGSFKVTLTATPSAIGTFTNPRGGGAASVDPSNVIAESNEANNNINSDSVVVTAPDLTVAKADDVSNATTLGNSWNWKLTVANTGNAAANFTNNQTILTDTLPATNITYGSPTAGTFSGITNGGNISCSIAASVLTCKASGATVTIAAATGSFVVSIPSTPTAIGTFTNPSASVDPGNVIVESNEGNNTSGSDAVVVTAPDLTLAKSNNVSGATTLGNNWTWTLTVSNIGNAPANFSNTQTILTDNLPNANVSYGVPTPGTFSGVTGSANISCAIASSNLTCTGTGAVSIAAPGSFQVTFTATPTNVGSFVNPRGGGMAKIDPSGLITESDETNNTASDTVTVTGPDLTLTKANDVTGTTTLGNSWSWTLAGTNGGNNTATFTSGQTILSDNLPNSNVVYGAPSTSNLTSVSGTGTISCSINGTSDLTCTASGGTVIIAAGGSFKVNVLATPSAIGPYANPRSGGTAKIDPNNNVGESDETNNTATDTVVVTAPDLTLTKTDSVGNATTLGNNWTWTLHVANPGNAAASFANGNTIVSDNLPNANITYGAVSVANKIGTAGTITCAIVTSDLTCTASGVVTISTGGSFDIQFVATPSAIGTFANPRSGGNATVDPSNAIPESNEGNNTAADTVSVTAPDLTLTKSNNVGNATTLGNSWTWTLTVNNGGNAPAIFASTSTILIDNLPNSSIGYGAPSAGAFTGVTGSASVSCSITGSDLTCSASGGAVTIGAGGSFQVTLLATPSAIGTFANPRGGGAASVDPANVVVESSESNNTASNTVVVTAPDLTISKSNNAPSPAVIGNPFTWTLHVANAGNSAASWSAGQTIVLDNLPNANMVYGAPAAANATGVTGTIVCSINGSFDLSCAASGGAVSLAAGGSFDVQFTATPSVAATYTNPRAGGTAKVDPNNNVVESNEANNTTSNSVVILAGADLTVSKSGPASAIAGDPSGYDYTLTVTNNGPIDNTGGFSVTDTLPSGVTFQSGSGCAAVAQVVTCTNTTGLTNGAQQSFTIHVLLASSSIGTISNTASVTSTGTPDPNSANNTSNIVMTTVVTQADLSITKSAPSTVVAGNAFDYTVVVTNNGPSDNAGGFVVTDTLPAGTLFQSVGSDSTCLATGQNVTCTIATGLVNGATRGITIHVSVPPTVANGTVLSNTATVASSGTSDPSSSNNVSAAATTTVQARADLSITKTAPATAVAGTAFDVTIGITNNGPSDDSGGFTVTDVLPGGLAFQSSGSSAGCSAAGQTVTCANNATLGNGAGQSLTIHVLLASTVAAGTDLANTASVSTNGTNDPNLTNNTSATQHTTVQAQADLAITKSGPATAIAGTAIDYMLSVTNNGPSANSGGFIITDALPAGVTFQSGAGCSAVGQIVSCSSSGLLAGASATFTIHVAVLPSVAEGTILHNAATISSTNTSDPNSANNTSSTFDTTIHANADLSITKSAPAAVIAGQPLAYTITVTNNGPSDAQSVVLHDVIPADAVFASQTQNSGPAFSTANSGNTINDTIATLVSGASATFTISTNVKPAPSTTTLTNTATIAATTTDPAANNNSSTATTSVSVAPVITTNPISQTICEQQSVTFTAAASGVPAPAVQWQVSTDGGVNFTNIAGATSTALTFTANASQNGNRYHAVFTNIAGSATSTAAALTVNTLPVITTQPSTAIVCENTTATFTAGAIGTPAPTVRWQVSTNGGATFTDIPGATSATYSHTAVASENGNLYRAVFTNACSTATTNGAILNVTKAPAITAPPLSKTVCAGTPVTFSVTATGGALTYQWRRNGVPLTGATGPSLTIARVAATDSGTWDVVVSGACSPSITSTGATLTVLPQPTAAIPSTSQNACAGSPVTIPITLAGNGPWQLTWSDGFIQSVTSSPASRVINANASRSYSINVVSDASCNNGVGTGTFAVALTLGPDVTIAAPAALCANAKDQVASVPQTGASYFWTATNATITSNAFTNRITFTPAGNGDVTLSVIGHFLNDPTGCSATSSVTVLIRPTLPAPVITGPSSITAGSALTLTASGGYTSYQWFRGGIAIAGATSGIYQVSSAFDADAGVYTAIGSTGGCTSPESSGFRVEVTPSNPTPEQPLTEILTVIGSTSGLNGSQFRDAMQLFNPTDVPIDGSFHFFITAPSSTTARTSSAADFTLAPHETRYFADVIGLGGFTGLATADLTIRSGAAPVGVLHIFNDAGEKGTAGLIERPLRIADALTKGDRAVLIAPSDPVTTRFNIGVRALTDGLAFHATVRDAHGSFKTAFDRTFGSSEFTQNSAPAWTGIPVAASDTITFDITAGAGVIYGSSTDNRTNDPNMQLAAKVVARTPATDGSALPLLRSVITVAGSTTGLFGSVFRTGFQLFNPGSPAMAATLRFHRAGVSGSDSDPITTIVVDPQTVYNVDDLVASMGLSGIGSIDLFTAGGFAPIAVTRVYGDAGVNGQTSITEELFKPEQALTKGQRGTIIAPHDATRLRFNIGVRTLESGATLTATVRSPGGAILRTVTLTFGPTYFEQLAAAQQLGVTFNGDESVTYEVTSGAAIVYAAWTDNISQDPSLHFARP
jgi:uncharacterized repeat protein (TIGR01451 family)